MKNPFGHTGFTRGLRSCCAVAVISSGLVIARQASAFDTTYNDTRWEYEHASVRISVDATLGYPYITTRYLEIRDGLSAWTRDNIPGSDFSIFTDSLREFRHASNLRWDSVSVIARVDKSDIILPFNVGARTWRRAELNTTGSGPRYWWREVYVLINDCSQFGGPPSYGWADPLAIIHVDPSDGYSNHFFEGVIRHEAGHVMGILHELYHVATMNALYSYAQGAYPTLHGDDRKASRYFYPRPDSEEPGPGWEADLWIHGWELFSQTQDTTAYLTPVPALPDTLYPGT